MSLVCDLRSSGVSVSLLDAARLHRECKPWRMYMTSHVGDKSRFWEAWGHHELEGEGEFRLARVFVRWGKVGCAGYSIEKSFEWVVEAVKSKLEGKGTSRKFCYSGIVEIEEFCRVVEAVKGYDDSLEDVVNRWG